MGLGATHPQASTQAADPQQQQVAPTSLQLAHPPQPNLHVPPSLSFPTPSSELSDGVSALEAGGKRQRSPVQKEGAVADLPSFEQPKQQRQRTMPSTVGQLFPQLFPQ